MLGVTEFVYCPSCGQQHANEPLLHCTCGKVFATIPGYTLVHETFLIQALAHAFRKGELTAFDAMARTVADGTLKDIDELLDENAEARKRYALDILALICEECNGK